MSLRQVLDSNADQLARLLALDRSSGGEESADRCAALLACQLRVPLAVDLPSIARSDAEALDLSRHLAQRPGETFGEMFARSDPPLLVLNLVKVFAKSALADPDAGLPRDVATVLYYAAIAAGLARLRHAPTRLKQKEVAAGLAWCASRPWAGTELAALFAEAGGCISQLAQPDT